MKKEDIEKYIADLSPELQKKARECKTMEVLNALLAENDVELSEDALGAVAGGCSSSSEEPYNKWIDEAYINVNRDVRVSDTRAECCCGQPCIRITAEVLSIIA